jgi:hypothetical protein
MIRKSVIYEPPFNFKHQLPLPDGAVPAARLERMLGTVLRGRLLHPRLARWRNLFP